MLYRELGKSGLKISAIGFGGIPIQRLSKEEAIKLIHKSEEMGINFIDTARGYTVSEEYIGEALEGRRDKWVIATKSMARTKEAMQRDIEISLKNLKTNYIDLYQIHNVKEMETYDQVVAEGGALEALIQAKNEGKIGHIGITAHAMDTLERAIEDGLFETIMYPYNIIENQAENLFKRAKELNIAVIAMKPMAGGALRNGNLAMRYILQNENITVVIPGMATDEEIIENSKAAIEYKPLDEKEIKECVEIREKMGQTFCRRCGYCAPCPKGIDIPFCFLLKAYYENYDLKDWAMERYDSIKSHAKDCMECGACEKKCPYDLPIRKMLKEVAETLGK